MNQADSIETLPWRERAFCGRLSPSDIGQEIVLMGWVDAIRDHGNLLFIHLRDTSGIVQVVFDPQRSPADYRKASLLREEFVVQVAGRVVQRRPGTENPNLVTGEIEVAAGKLVVLSEARPLPFPISEKAMVFGEELHASPDKVDEDLRLRYRYLDIRRPSVQEILKTRYILLKTIRDALHEQGFIEVETPILTRSTPEGARDYLVPSRLHRGKFYSLPQSPQLFKQLLMVGGIDRYFQIARCFRDEDLRPNRQPEFSQLDLEAAFIDETFIYEVVEEVVCRMFSVAGIALRRPFPRMTYENAMARYGTDKPDLRFGMEFHDLTQDLRSTGYDVFQRIIRDGGRIKGFSVKAGSRALSKNVLQNDYAQGLVPALGGRGMTWMKMIDGRLQSNVAQFFREEELHTIARRLEAQDGDVIVMIADVSTPLVNKVLCSLRLDMARRLGMIDQSLFQPLWVTHFPLFELKEEGIGSKHHPFTMPEQTDFDPTDREQLLMLHSRAYDLVINGEECGGGSIRIHRMEIQQKIFAALGLTQAEAETKFGFFLKALQYGTPPHGGLALGIDRLLALILGLSSIREGIAFPKNRSAACPLTQAPAEADPAQLRELGLAGKVTASAETTASQPTPVAGRPAAARGTISREEVLHVARLSRLQLDKADVECFQHDLAAVLDYVNALAELDIENVEPMSHVLEIKNVWREDVAASTEDPSALLAAAPESEQGYYKVPKILES